MRGFRGSFRACHLSMDMSPKELDKVQDGLKKLKREQTMSAWHDRRNEICCSFGIGIYQFDRHLQEGRSDENWTAW